MARPTCSAQRRPAWPWRNRHPQRRARQRCACRGTGADNFRFDSAQRRATSIGLPISPWPTTASSCDDIFTAIGALGTLSTNAFRAGTAAQDVDRIIDDARARSIATGSARDLAVRAGERRRRAPTPTSSSSATLVGAREHPRRSRSAGENLQRFDLEEILSPRTARCRLSNARAYCEHLAQVNAGVALTNADFIVVG